MKILKNYTPVKMLLISLICAVIVAYPNILYISWELTFVEESKLLSFWLFFAFRYVYFTLIFWFLFYQNINRLKMAELKLRLTRTALIIIPAFAIFFVMCYLYYTKYFHVSTIICQFVVIAAITVVTGHLSMLYIKQRKHEQEIEQLKVENLQSRCDALINQINPHFFFNSLNSINSLARKVNDEEVLAYVDTLSDVFRYILQSDKKGLVALRDELEFVNAFRYMMGVRYANKLSFDIDIDESKLDLSIPVLSLLPVIDNVITHNRIDSDYYMNVTIEVNEKDELVISNPIYPKLTPPDTNGTGIKNLENRFALMMNTKIRIEDDEQLFRVYLPLK